MKGNKLPHLRKPIMPVINETKAREYKITTNTGRSQISNNYSTASQCSVITHYL